MQTEPDKEWLAAIVAVAGNRCVWGSDWPFTPPQEQQAGAALVAPYRTIGYQTLVDDFLAALPSPDLADRIMIDNPARFYEF